MAKSRFQDVATWRRSIRATTRPSRPSVCLGLTSTPRSGVTGSPSDVSAAITCGWVTIPAPRAASSTGDRSKTWTSQPSRSSRIAEKSPPTEPPITSARRDAGILPLRCLSNDKRGDASDQAAGFTLALMVSGKPCRKLSIDISRKRRKGVRGGTPYTFSRMP